jgi:hypothetical protein
MSTDIRALSTDICLLSTDICLLSTDNRLLSTDNRLLSTDNRPLSTDIRPLSIDIRPLSIDIRPLLTDNRLLSTDKWLMSTDQSLESVTASPLSADQGVGFTAPPSPRRSPSPQTMEDDDGNTTAAGLGEQVDTRGYASPPSRPGRVEWWLLYSRCARKTAARSCSFSWGKTR